MLLPQCKKVFVCKVKMKNLFSLQLQQNFLVQQCFLPLFFLFRRRILLKPSYNSCGGAVTCTNMISHGMPDSACKKVFACKVKMKNLFSLQLQQNFLVQQCFLPLFFLFRRRILLKPSYNSCGGAVTCTNMISHRCFRRFSLAYCILRQKRHFSTKFAVNVRLA